jgi:hypothetical protein
LWEHSEEHFRLPAGYYQLVHVFLLMAYRAETAMAQIVREALPKRGYPGIQACHYSVGKGEEEQEGGDHWPVIYSTAG